MDDRNEYLITGEKLGTVLPAAAQRHGKQPGVHTPDVVTHAGPESPPGSDMVWIPGGTFRMGSDDHYPEEAPARTGRASTGSGWTGTP